MFPVPPRQKLRRDLREQCQRQHILLGFGDFLEFFLVFFQLRGNVVRRTAGDDLLRVDACQRPDLRVYLAGSAPYSPRSSPLDSLGNVLYLPTITFITACVPTI